MYDPNTFNMFLTSYTEGRSRYSLKKELALFTTVPFEPLSVRFLASLAGKVFNFVNSLQCKSLNPKNRVLCGYFLIFIRIPLWIRHAFLNWVLEFTSTFASRKIVGLFENTNRNPIFEIRSTNPISLIKD